MFSHVLISSLCLQFARNAILKVLYFVPIAILELCSVNMNTIPCLYLPTKDKIKSLRIKSDLGLQDNLFLYPSV